MLIEELLVIDLAQPRWPWLGLAHLGCDRSGDIVTHWPTWCLWRVDRAFV